MKMLPRRFVLLALPALLAGCAVGPRYARPDTGFAAAFKEAPAADGWVPAQPGDALDRGDWWTRFGDPELDALAARVQVSNQNIAAAVANYAQAQALVREQQAALLPTLSLEGSARRSGPVRGGGASSRSYAASVAADWSPDLWGRLGEAVDSAQANAQASAADLASARLSSIGALAANYLALREADAEIVLLDETITGYERALAITRNRYDAGIAAQTDVLQAQTQLLGAQAERVALRRSRATYEHAIAVLVGVTPSEFAIAPAAWRPVVPAVPTGLPSLLLQRRPDIAGAERAVARANAQIGIARAAYYPSIGLSASLGGSASRVGDLFSASSLLWALGVSVAQTVFDGGARDAATDAARAAHASSVANYRQTVLSAFQDVEDQLSATAALAEQAGLRREASQAADRTEQQMLNRYRAGQVGYSEVVSAQASALSARRTLAQVQLARQTAAVSLIQALGGGWEADWLRQP
ncbi:efflux transporter outer membrane subunit [Pseudorhodoferax sp. Leaf265]|jgi:NodT family efflux transporter outer membrane factor (OMF) lipoprotein|uniref:efflux transporter outer membrane subunit n=1 Tax=Pseudorhodoferax sp. Leaf265 TaxID=1736315 RepID=UPI0006FAECBA|nr:efflux transporter outer membrane subunit [Pseudorhodoferax sp. Leaf265]KQP21351.1 RND transporter [Pseudorhodoferax sp. Leaf265]